jgi:predicted nucleotidyltransferase
VRRSNRLKLRCCEEAPMPDPLFTDREALSAVCRPHHIRRLALFGSVLNGTSQSDSDVDLLVEFEPDAKPTLLTMAEIELELSPLLRGRKVDLRTPPDLSRYFRDEVLRTAQVEYEVR